MTVGNKEIRLRSRFTMNGRLEKERYSLRHVSPGTKQPRIESHTSTQTKLIRLECKKPEKDESDLINRVSGDTMQMSQIRSCKRKLTKKRWKNEP